MIYQMIIKRLNELKEQGTDIGNAIHYCSQNIFDLVDMHDNQAVSVPALVNICLENK